MSLLKQQTIVTESVQFNRTHTKKKRDVRWMKLESLTIANITDNSN